jgi:tetratricopeptide (TPR) repeat protein
MWYLALVARLFYDPIVAAAALRRARPVWQALGAAAGATALYQAVLLGAHRDAAGIVRVGGYDFGGAAIVAGHLAALVPLTIAPVVLIALAYVPACLLVLAVAGPDERPGAVLRASYEPTAAAALSFWAATVALWLVPAALFADPVNPRSAVTWLALPLAFFAGWMTVGFVGVAGSGYRRAAFASLLGAVTLAFVPIAWFFPAVILGPFVLAALLAALGRALRSWSAAREGRERLQRDLRAVAINPYDADAHTDLGLVYQERGDVDRAAYHFERAVAADPTEVRALYELGRIARSEGRLSEAIDRFDAVVQLDVGFANGEVWREVGATYRAAGQHVDAREALERFLERRPSDAEGLYMLGATLAALGLGEEARERMRATIEAVRTAPPFKYRRERRWLAEAEKFLNGEGRLS